MLRILALVAALLPAFTVGEAGAQDFRDTFTAVTPGNFDSGGAISRQFNLHPESYLRMASIERRADARELATTPSRDLASLQLRLGGKTTDFADYVAGDALIDAVIVLHDGAILFEAYPNMQPWQRHFAWSVTKVLTSTTLAVLVERGEVDMQAPVDRYLPALKDSAWAGIPVQHIADMASGIDCLDSDGYQDKTTCVYTMEESLGITAATGREPNFITHLQGMQMHREAGRKNEYVSANTNVLGLVIEAVTGMPYAQAVAELIWNPIGAEADALMAISADGYAYASGGLHARLRDVARFGQVFTAADTLGVLTPVGVAAMQSGGVSLGKEAQQYLQNVFAGDVPTRASWQWDMVWDDGAMFKSGYDGQGLYVDPARNLVLAWFGTGLNYSATTNMMLPVARQLAQSTLFKTGDK
jgi:CubicO group peptidase (beta-lactamase class C family)